MPPRPSASSRISSRRVTLEPISRGAVRALRGRAPAVRGSRGRRGLGPHLSVVPAARRALLAVETRFCVYEYEHGDGDDRDPDGALTNLAATGASPIAVMATAGHRSMQTTKQYVHLAGVVFRDEASALERRLLGIGAGPVPDDDLGELPSDDGTHNLVANG